MYYSSQAEVSGRDGEDSVEDILKRHKLSYTKQYNVGTTMWKKTKADFYVEELDIIIEVKTQNTVGSVDEKFVYLTHAIKNYYPHRTIIVLVGTAHSYEMVSWCKTRYDKVFTDILHISELEDFIGRC